MCVKRFTPHTRRPQGFTLIELLVVISIIALLIGILLPSLASAREMARAISCSSQMRQLALAAELYADESRDRYPPRDTDPRWPAQFQRTYQVAEMLICPSEPEPNGNPDAEDFDDKPRGYMFNGFDDFDHTDATWDENAKTSMNRAEIKQASELAMFGEQVADGSSYWVDIYSADEYLQIEQSRHGNGQENNGTGYSNYAFADTSVRSMPFGESLAPIRLWAVTEAERNQPYVITP